jgi:hypothetical protein
MIINNIEFYPKYLLQVDFLLMVVVVKKKKKMLVRYHHLQLVVEVFVVFLDHQMLYHEIKFYNIQPRRRRRRGKLHTDQIRKEGKFQNVI